MAISYATITGKITQPGTDIGIRAKVTATPLTEDEALTFGGERITWGSQTAETDAAGNLADLKIPLGSDTPGVLWRLTASPINKIPGLRTWTLGTFDITASARLDELVNVTPTATIDTLANGTRGAANGVAPLDSTSRVPEANLPAGLAAATLSATYVAAKTPATYGAVGDGVTNDTAALQAFLNAGGGYIPARTYAITATLTIPAGAQVDSDVFAIFRATAPIAGPMVDTPVGTTLRNVTYRLPLLDCNDLADTGFWPRRFGNMKTPQLRILDPKLYGLVAGDPAAASTSFGGEFDVAVDRTFGSATPANSIGVWARYAGDCSLWSPQGPVGFKTGVQIEAVCGDWKLWNVHPWSYGNDMTTGFDDAADGTVYHGCIADTPGNAGGVGFRVRGSRPRFFGCLAMLNNSGPDNTATGWYFHLAASNAFLSGCDVIGADATHRFAKDFDGAAGFDINVFIVQSQSLNVATPTVTTQRITNVRTRYQLTDAGAFGIRNAAGTQFFAYNTGLGSERLEIVNGATVRGYTDNFTTRSWTLSNNGIGLPKFTTAGRPAAATAGEGFGYYDQTLHKPVWSDGTTWRDSAGTAV